MKRAHALVAALLACFGVAPVNARYGESDAVPIREIKSAPKPLRAALERAAARTVLLVRDSTLELRANGVRVKVADVNQCRRPNATQGGVGVVYEACSGIFITPWRILTAAHCVDLIGGVDGVPEPSKMRAILDFKSPRIVDQWALIKTENVREVTRAVYCRRSAGVDIAVLEVDRPVPESFARGDLPRVSPKVGEAVHLLSFPLGLPLRVSSCLGKPDCAQAAVSMVSEHSFRAPIDSFPKSSGGPVISSTGKLMGVLSQGANPRTWAGTCYRDETYSMQCKGQRLSRVDMLPAELFDEGSDLESVNCELATPAEFDPECPQFN